MKRGLLIILSLFLLLSGCYSDAELAEACKEAREEGYAEGKKDYKEELEKLNDPDSVYFDVNSEEFSMKELGEIMYDGYSDGYDIGYDEGYDEGFSDGVSNGYDDGYDEGYEVGKSAANVEASAKSEESVSTSSSSPSSEESTTNTDTQTLTVYVTNTGSKYHMNGCQYLRQSQNAISLSAAKAAGYTPCSRCHPPQ